VLLNVVVARRFDPTTVPAIAAAVRRIEKQLQGEGRVVLRASGTEPVIRVMVEGRDAAEVRGCADALAGAVRLAAAPETAPT
jgi:phosphoglucosamine mutase